MFARLGTWCHDHRRIVLAAWVAVLVLGGILANVTGSAFRDEFSLPDVESKHGFDILDADFGGQGTGLTGTVVFRADQGVRDSDLQPRLEALLADVDALAEVDRVESPFTEAGARQISPDGTVAYANVELPDDVDFEAAVDVRDEILAAAGEIEGVQTELGGYVFAEFEEPKAELIGLAFAVVVLIAAFGSVLAMGLPVGVALFGIGLGTAIIAMLSHLLSIPDFATFLGIMIGLGVGIDYALLIVTRFREQLHLGSSVRQATAVAIDTAGRSVLFAGSTVVISLLGMLLMQVSFVEGLAVGAASVVAVTVVASLTLLPALLGFAAHRVELTRRRGLVAAALVAVALIGMGTEITPLVIGAPVAVLVLLAGTVVKPLKRQVAMRPQKPRRETTAYRWSRVVQRRPWAAALAGTAILLLLATPTLGLQLGFSDESNFEESTTTRRAYDLLADGFGPGFNGPFMLVAQTDAPASLAAVTAAVSADPGVAFASPPVPNDPASPTAVLWHVVPTTGPQDPVTEDLVDRLRDEVLPPIEAAAGVDVAVTGTVPVNVDFADYLSERLPLFFAAVLALSFLLLMVVFRSLLVPLKAVAMNLLSIGAAYGVVVALFQWGWLSDITGVQPAPIEPWAPMMLFAIVFGLSMDYEVFLLSRIREEWHRTGDARESVADGLAATAKVITAAAAIMVVVFGAFMLESDRVLKLMGTGLATAILLDATVVRMLLVPATMELLGDRNWWLPRWLDRLLPTIDVEGHAERPEDEPTPDSPPPEPEPALVGP